MKHRLLIAIIMLLTSAAMSCKKDISQVDESSIKINYFAGSDVLKSYALGGIGIFVDTPPFNVPTSTGSRIPYFSTAIGQAQLEFPKIYGASGLMYTPYFSGPHHFQLGYMAPDSVNTFTGTQYTNKYADTTFNITTGSEALLYLVDAPPSRDSADPQFKLMIMDANRFLQLDTGQVAVRIIHQSPDTEPLKLSRVNLDGSFTTEGLSQHLQYGTFTTYLLLNTKEAKNGLLALRMYSTITGNELVNTAIPANAGHAYTLAITGFQQTRNFRIPVNVNADKKLIYDNVNIPANLRAEIRQIW